MNIHRRRGEWNVLTLVLTKKNKACFDNVLLFTLPKSYGIGKFFVKKERTYVSVFFDNK
jgi:hypothetical protein